MSPGEAREILAKRAAWLEMKLSDKPDRNLFRAEWAAIQAVFALLDSLEGRKTDQERKRQAAQTQRIRARTAAEYREQKQRCTCERCPVHSTGDKT